MITYPLCKQYHEALFMNLIFCLFWIMFIIAHMYMMIPSCNIHSIYRLGEKYLTKSVVIWNISLKLFFKPYTMCLKINVTHTAKKPIKSTKYYINNTNPLIALLHWYITNFLNQFCTSSYKLFSNVGDNITFETDSTDLKSVF